MKLRIVILGLSISSSWGNGHATVYRGLVRQMRGRGHSVLFLERNKPWYAQNRDLPPPLSDEVEFYESLPELQKRFAGEVRSADCVILGSYVPEGAKVGRWVAETATGITAFYDIDTPVTVSQLLSGGCEYLDPELIPEFALYLSFTGGPILNQISGTFGSPMARAFYCCVDPERYFPDPSAGKAYDLGHIGTYSLDRRAPLERLLLDPARMLPASKFIVAGPMYPADIRWPSNVQRAEHIAPLEHRAFYNAQRFTLNVTRSEMIRAGYSPSVRLFEAAACGVPIITDYWAGLEEYFQPGTEILAVRSTQEVVEILKEIGPTEARNIADAARKRVLQEHTAAKRVVQLEQMLAQIGTSSQSQPARGSSAIQVRSML